MKEKILSDEKKKQLMELTREYQEDAGAFDSENLKEYGDSALTDEAVKDFSGKGIYF